MDHFDTINRTIEWTTIEYVTIECVSIINKNNI